MSRASKPAKQNGTSSAETIRASGQRPREQAGHKTAPDQHARPSQTPCNAGAIHTGQSAFGPESTSRAGRSVILDASTGSVKQPFVQVAALLAEGNCFSR